MATLATNRDRADAGIGGAGNRIAEVRLGRGLSQEELAERLGCTKSQLSRLETGNRRLTRAWLGRIAAALDVAPEELLGEPPLFSLQGGGDARPAAPADPFGRGRGVAVEDVAPAPERTLPVCGFGRFGLPEGVGVFVEAGDAPERVWCPAPLARVRGAYAVRMPDGSMLPKYQPNQLLFVHPFRAPQPGAPVVVRSGGRFLVAAFVGVGRDTVRLERHRPAHPFEIARDGIEAVECVAVSEER